MNNFIIENNDLTLESITGKGKKLKKIALSDPILLNFMNSVESLFNSLRENDCDWKANDNFLLMDLIHKGLIFTKKLKKMNSNTKKKLILSLILNVLDKEVKKNDKLQELKDKIVEGIETVVEPAIELAMMTQNNEFKIPKNFMISLLSVCKKGQVN